MSLPKLKANVKAIVKVSVKMIIVGLGSTRAELSIYIKTNITYIYREIC